MNCITQSNTIDVLFCAARQEHPDRQKLNGSSGNKSPKGSRGGRSECRRDEGVAGLAEAYHQDYLTLHPISPYIAYYDLPKIEDLKRLFPLVYREKPVLVSAR